MKRENVVKNLICLLALIFAMGMLAGCGGADDGDWAADEAAEADDWDDWDDDADGDWDDDANWAADIAGDEDEPQLSVMEVEADDATDWDFGAEDEVDGYRGEIPILLPSESGRQLVYAIEINMQTTDFDGGIRILRGIVGELNGHPERELIIGRDYRDHDVERSASFNLRIPNENIIEFILFAEANYNIVRLELEMDDLSVIYESEEARVDRLRDREQQIIADLNADDDDDETDVTQADLDEVRDLLRDAEAEAAGMQHDVDYSRIIIRLAEVILPVDEVEDVVEPETFGDRLQNTLESSLSGILGIFQNILLLVIIILPWLFLIALFVVPIAYLVKRYRKNGADNEPHNSNGSNEADSSNGSGNPLIK